MPSPRSFLGSGVFMPIVRYLVQVELSLPASRVPSLDVGHSVALQVKLGSMIRYWDRHSWLGFRELRPLVQVTLGLMAQVGISHT